MDRVTLTSRHLRALEERKRNGIKLPSPSNAKGLRSLCTDIMLSRNFLHLLVDYIENQGNASTEPESHGLPDEPAEDPRPLSHNSDQLDGLQLNNIPASPSRATKATTSVEGLTTGLREASLTLVRSWASKLVRNFTVAR
ncbi:hypothetical protein TWF481_010402 [Arthrobotrys musiformis]|uniref:Uncharacterized protein n=1 Tax=Arthrobotrys musiformis TaxID=47236 RepID=A0AAV9W222_9PEZI